MKDRIPTLSMIAMPKYSNADGDIFGGWLLAQMDLAGAVKAREVTRNRVVTVGIDAMNFHKPVFVGDKVNLYTELVKIGNTSITVKVESWAYRPVSNVSMKVTEGIFTFVAINEDREPVLIKK